MTNLAALPPISASLRDVPWSAEQLWQAISDVLRNHLGVMSYRGMIEPLRPLRRHENTLVLNAPSVFLCQHVDQQYGHTLSHIATIITATPTLVQICYQENTSILPIPSEELEIFPSVTSGHKKPSSKSVHPTLPLEGLSTASPAFSASTTLELHPRMRFETWIQGARNRVASKMIQALAHKDLTAPFLVLVGDHGMGKTHLLHSAAHARLQHSPMDKVCLLTAEAWVNLYIRHVQTKTLDVFRSYMRAQQHLVLIDDIHFLSGKTGSQEEFLHMLQSLSLSRGVILTSPVYPQDIPHLDYRLQQFLGGALIVDLGTLEQHEAFDAVALWTKERDAILPTDVQHYLVQTFGNTIRSLEGAVARLCAYVRITQEPCSLSLAQQYLKPLAAQQKEALPKPHAVIQTVAVYFGLKPEDITGKSRHKNIAKARHIAVWLMREKLSLSFAEIGNYCGGRDHSTIMSSWNKIQNAIQEDASTRALLETLQDAFKL